MLSNSVIRNNKLNLKLKSAAFSVTDCSVAVSSANQHADYLIETGGGGVALSNTNVEGNANEALFNILGTGVSIQGGYSENTRSRFADITITASVDGNIDIKGMYMPNNAIKFIGLYKGGAETEHFVPSYSMSHGISINAKGEFIPSFINPNFKHGTFGWSLSGSDFTSEIINTNTFFSKQAIRLTKTEGTTPVGIRQTFQAYNPNNYITCMIKRSPNPQTSLYAFHTTNTLYRMRRIATYGDTGWELWGVWVPPLEVGRTFTLHIGLSGTTPTGEWIEVSNVGLYANGFDYFPIEREETIRRNAIPTTGTWSRGDIVWNIGTDNNVAFWRRLTDGSTHVLGADWKAH